MTHAGAMEDDIAGVTLDPRLVAALSQRLSGDNVVDLDRLVDVRRIGRVRALHGEARADISRG
jgi:hypothetical protein